MESEITVEQDGDDVVVGRHATNSTPPGMFAPFWPNHPPRVDKFTKMRWMAPSTLRLFTGICKIGAAPESGTGYNAIHMLTPQSERSTLYHFTAVRFGVMTTDEKVNRDLQERIPKMRRFAFAEQDAPVIEAQQRMIENAMTPLDPSLPQGYGVVPTGAKVGIDATVPENIPPEYYERITYAYADTAKIDDYVNGKKDTAGESGDEATVATLADEIAVAIGKAPLYYTDLAERFSKYDFVTIARAIGQLHETEKLWQDYRGRLCLRDSTFAAKPPGK